MTEADKQTLSQANKSLQDKPESQYTFDDWNTRAHAANAENAFALAAEYWKNAATATGATDEQVAHALLNQGVMLGRQGKSEEEIANYQQVVKCYGDSPLSALQELVAQVLVNQGVALGQQGKPEEEIAFYQQVVKRYGDSPLPALQEQVAMALFNQGVTLGQQGNSEEAIACYQQVVKRYGDTPSPALQEFVAKALVNQGAVLGRKDKHEEANACYQQVVARYGDSPLPALQEQVASAFNGHGFIQLVQSKRSWNQETERTKLLSESLVLFERAKEKTQDIQDKAMVLGNVAYALWLLGRESEVETPLREALTMGGEKTFKDEIADTKISPVPKDAGFEQLVTRLWKEISSKSS